MKHKYKIGSLPKSLTNWYLEFKGTEQYDEIILLASDYINGILDRVAQKHPEITSYDLFYDWEDYIGGRIFYPSESCPELTEIFSYNEDLSLFFDSYFSNNFLTLNGETFFHFQTYFRTIFENLFAEVAEAFIDPSMPEEHILYVKNFFIDGLIYKFCCIKIDLIRMNQTEENLSVLKKADKRFCHVEETTKRQKILTYCISPRSISQLKYDILFDFILKYRDVESKHLGLTKKAFKQFCVMENISLFSSREEKLLLKFFKNHAEEFTEIAELVDALMAELDLINQDITVHYEAQSKEVITNDEASSPDYSITHMSFFTSGLIDGLKEKIQEKNAECGDETDSSYSM